MPITYLDVPEGIRREGKHKLVGAIYAALREAYRIQMTFEGARDEAATVATVREAVLPAVAPLLGIGNGRQLEHGKPGRLAVSFASM